MELIFEKEKSGRKLSLLPEGQKGQVDFSGMCREKPLRLPQVSESQISRHYTQLAGRTYGVNDGFIRWGLVL